MTKTEHLFAFYTLVNKDSSFLPSVFDFLGSSFNEKDILLLFAILSLTVSINCAADLFGARRSTSSA